MREQYYQLVSECPLDVWEKCYESGYSNLRLRQPSKWWIVRLFQKKLTADDDYNAWDKLFIDFINRVGLDPEFEKYIRNLQKLISLQYKFIKSQKENNGVEVRDRKILNLIKLVKIDILKFESTGNESGLTIDGMLGKISKMQGYKVKKSDTMVLEYFELIKDLRAWR